MNTHMHGMNLVCCKITSTIISKLLHNNPLANAHILLVHTDTAGKRPAVLYIYTTYKICVRTHSLIYTLIILLHYSLPPSNGRGQHLFSRRWPVFLAHQFASQRINVTFFCCCSFSLVCWAAKLRARYPAWQLLSRLMFLRGAWISVSPLWKVTPIRYSDKTCLSTH